MESAENWVLLRGLARESGHWGEFVPRFMKSRPTAQVITLDLPGSGQDWRGQSPRDISEITDHLRSGYRQLGGSDPIHLLAISLGGMIAFDWMARYPSELKAVAIINASVASLNPFYQRLRWQIWTELVRLLGIRDLREREAKILSLVCNSEAARERQLPIWSELARTRPISRANLLRQIWAASQFRLNPALGRAKVPVALLVGSGDRLVDPSCSRQLQAQFSHWQLFLHPWAGHDLPADDPDWMCQTLAAWLDKKHLEPSL